MPTTVADVRDDRSRIRSPLPSPRIPSPALQPAEVAPRIDLPAHVRAHPNIGRGVARGALLGFLLVASFVTILGLASGVGPGGALGMGVVAGLWGGCGFGGMLGAFFANPGDQS